MGVRALKSHVGSETHKKNHQESFDMFFKPNRNKKQNVSDSAGPSSVSNTQVVEMTQTKLSNVVGNTSVVEAEIRWLLKCVNSGFSNNSNQHMGSLFQKMFSDSNVAS